MNEDIKQILLELTEAIKKINDNIGNLLRVAEIHQTDLEDIKKRLDLLEEFQIKIEGH